MYKFAFQYKNNDDLNNFSLHIKFNKLPDGLVTLYLISHVLPDPSSVNASVTTFNCAQILDNGLTINTTKFDSNCNASSPLSIVLPMKRLTESVTLDGYSNKCNDVVFNVRYFIVALSNLIYVFLVIVFYNFVGHFNYKFAVRFFW